MWNYYQPYVPVAQRRANAAREMAKRRKKGEIVSPVVIEGRTIARTFWGKAWCDNLESYSDYDNRLERGRTYVRNGSVVDLQINAGKVSAWVSGSELYEVGITIAPLPAAKWESIKARCAGQVGSMVELLQGRLADNVIAIVTAKGDGLFPKPSEIKMSCTCPDGIGMCKHVAAVAYGIGARFDTQPEMLFTLRQVNHQELIEEAVERASKKSTTRKKTIAADELSSVFGIEMAKTEVVDSAPQKTATPKSSKAVKAKPVAKAASKPVAKAVKSAPKPKRTGKASPPPQGRTRKEK